MRVVAVPTVSADEIHGGSKRSAGSRQGRYALLLIILALVALTLISYRHITRAGFVFDDQFYLTENSHVQQGMGLDTVKWAFTAFYGANWQPLTWLSSMLDYELYESNPLGHHATNLFFHLANAVLLLLVLRRMTSSRMWEASTDGDHGGIRRPGTPSIWKCAFVAAVFALHPLHVESAAWLSERKDVLSTFFMLLAVWAYARYAERPSVRRYLLTASMFVLGLMAKPMLVSLPILLLLMDYWPLGRKSSVGRLVLEKTPLFALSLVSCVVTYLAQRSMGAVAELYRYSVGLRISNALVSYAVYIEKALWPTGLAAYYPYPRGGVPALSVAIAVLALTAVSVLALRQARTRPYLAVGWLWYIVTLIPVIGLVQVGGQAMADRYMYIPLIGLSVAAAWGVPDLLGPGRRVRIGLAGASGLAVLGMAVVTSAQVGYWQDNGTLFGRAASVTRGCGLVFSNYGLALAGNGEYDKAMEQYQKAIEVDPNYVQSYLNLGNALNEMGEPEAALEQYAKALDINPDFVEASRAAAFVHNDIGTALGQKGENEMAIGEFERAIELDPDCIQAHGSLAIAYYTVHRYREAWEQVRIVQSHGVELPPGFVEALSAKMAAR